MVLPNVEKEKSLAPFYCPEVISSASDNANWLLKLTKNFNVDDPGTFIPAVSSRTILKLHNIPVTPALIEKGV